MEDTGSKVSSGNRTVNFSSDSDLSPGSKPNTLEEYSSSLASKRINEHTIKKDRNSSTHIKTIINNINRLSSTNQPDANSNAIYEMDEQNLKPDTSCISSDINENLNETIETTLTKTNNDGTSKDFSNRTSYLASSNRNTTNFL
ncbi:hypothetical protein O181_033003 [Austropuccinia psidii MF-1]|uniref:Uncharacterized protein n=1 Tax=Austropuccinia psidii MF-1 TaxID=1389203 RepID=A0A9Q3D2R1_9BASI|nr:hypothetical protein [Austropuccinia psidii MF-1]